MSRKTYVPGFAGLILAMACSGLLIVISGPLCLVQSKEISVPSGSLEAVPLSCRSVFTIVLISGPALAIGISFGNGAAMTVIKSKLVPP